VFTKLLVTPDIIDPSEVEEEEEGRGRGERETKGN